MLRPVFHQGEWLVGTSNAFVDEQEGAPGVLVLAAENKHLLLPTTHAVGMAVGPKSF